jgi:phage terminase large subunit
MAKQRQDRERIQRLEQETARRKAENEDPSPPQFADGPSLVLDPNHKLYCLLHRKAPYKVLKGGRDSTKSWGIAEALIRLATTRPVRILCVREFQTSIKDSSHKLLKDTISRLGLDSWFSVTATGITSRAGAEFLFRGLYQNEHGLRSVEGIDYCWVEEAQTVSETSWQSLLPTIRKENAEIWISFNPLSEDDATHVRFVKTEMPGSIVVHLTYHDNPYMSTRSRELMEADKARDFHLYEHIWLGMHLVVSDAIIFSGKYTIRDFDRLNGWKDVGENRLFYGADFGFANDPSTLMRFWPVDSDYDGKKRLYISHAEFGYKVELDDLAHMYDKVPGSREWPIGADCARPETISYLRRTGGFNIYGAEKWQGCVEDGITHLKGFDEIVIHPECDKEFHIEARNYKYKVDPKQKDAKGQPKVLPIVVDAYNHGWDGIRYGFDQYIMRGGALSQWARLAGR